MEHRTRHAVAAVLGLVVSATVPAPLRPHSRGGVAVPLVDRAVHSRSGVR